MEAKPEDQVVVPQAITIKGDMATKTNTAVFPKIFQWTNSDLFWAIGVLILIGMAVVGVSGTWTTLTATYDEPIHIASGMEWLDKGSYLYELQHPPLARVAVAIGPYLKGLRSSSLLDGTAEGNAILYSGGNYWSNLAAARAGNLLFL